MGRRTDTFGRMKFQLLQILPFQAKTYICCKQKKQDRVIDASFILHGEFYPEKYSKVFLWNPCNVLMRKKEKRK